MSPDQKIPQAQGASGLTATSVCVFRVGKRAYCVPTGAVEYVYPYCEVTPLPHMSACIEGAVNIKGSIILVVDMGLKCKDRALSRDPSHILLLMRVGTHQLALHVEQISDVVDVATQQWESADTILPGIRMLSGVMKYKDGLALMYAPESFFLTELDEHGNL